MRQYLGTYKKINNRKLKKDYSLFKQNGSLFLVAENEPMLAFKSLKQVSEYLKSKTN